MTYLSQCLSTRCRYSQCSTTGVINTMVFVCGMLRIKEPLLLIRKSSPCGGSRFPLSHLSGPLLDAI